MSFIDSIHNRDFQLRSWLDKQSRKYFEKDYKNLNSWELKEFKRIMTVKGYRNALK